jgi:hypothetical protein
MPKHPRSAPKLSRPIPHAKKKQRPSLESLLPPPTDWRTSDEDELNKRRLRAREEKFRITNLDPEHPIFSNFEVRSPSGMTYQAEVRDVAQRQFSCTCTDFRINGLGTCKHIEGLLLHLARRHRAEFKGAQALGSYRVDLVPHPESGRLRVERHLENVPKKLRGLFDAEGYQVGDTTPDELVAEWQACGCPEMRLSQDVPPWLEANRRERDRVLLRRDYECGVREGRYPEHVTSSPLFPYQREGMLHLAFTERALLADEMGLGKTIQAIAACALLHHLGKARRVLLVTPASLKGEWEEQIMRFTRLPLRLVYGGRSVRTRLYEETEPPFFTITNYEQIVADSLDINTRLRPDVVVLDEAQRIKNWSTKTAQAVKRLESRYAFVLTGTPIENRIDELRSIVDFLNPQLLGPLFRFNREYYTLDERGRPAGYRNLDKLRERIRPVLLRRRKADVETELPDRTDRNLFVALTPTMRSEYADYERNVKSLVEQSKRRPLTPREQDMLMVMMNIMRMICDSPGIMKNNPSEECPKLDELARVLDECLSDADVKVIIFSEWEGMLRRVKSWADGAGIGYAWHTGSVPQKQRRAEIHSFRNDPECRLFLSTDSGGVGLNLQNASVVINCDLPWNPAKLEQRIARAWRKNQLRPVTVVNLVAENTIEHGMLGSLAQKMDLAQGVLDGRGDLSEIKLRGGRQAFLKRLEQIMAKVPSDAPAIPQPPSDPAAHFAGRIKAALAEKLTACEESYVTGSQEPIVFAVLHRASETDQLRVQELFHETPWIGTPPKLQLLDQTTWAALQNLAAAGLISIHSRATRPLLPTEGQDAPPPLTREEVEKIAMLRATAAKKRRAALALRAEDLLEEAEALNQAATAAEEQATAIERRTPIAPNPS